ncbi:hypothetical protein [Pseudolabrys sp. FHR47]|uniref:hypothetical protein n=1 Tax=Pseudolabrys sp. FHR47 TaxID=2562284 RepID=UPI0010BF044D|nr:hypothetical protein [Pseudolabrys sp. FHR47]
MKFLTPERSELIVITAVDKHPDGLVISGKIMGAMPMKAVLTPAQLRAGFKFLSPKLVFTVIGMLFRR